MKPNHSAGRGYTMSKLVEWLKHRRPGTILKVRERLAGVIRIMGIAPISATLSARVFHDGQVEDLGIISAHAVTDVFVQALIDALQAPVVAFSTYKYHGSGESDTEEAATDTVLWLPTGEARDIGTQTEGSASNIYKSVATHTYDGPFAITEHGLFNALTGGTLMDRSTFTAIDVVATKSIEFTYQLLCESGG